MRTVSLLAWLAVTVLSAPAARSKEVSSVCVTSLSCPVSSCSPKVVRPAGNETGVGWRGAAGTEVGFRLGAREPVFQLDPGPSEHPRLYHGRPAGPEHAC